jgi:ProP effector
MNASTLPNTGNTSGTAPEPVASLEPEPATDPELGTTTEPEAAPALSPRDILQILQADFPVFQKGLPLVIGIDKELRARLPQLSRKLLRMALGMHTHSTRYLRVMVKATHRFDLDGNAIIELAEEHRQYAQETLRERLKKQAETRQTEQQARRKAAREVGLPPSGTPEDQVPVLADGNEKPSGQAPEEVRGRSRHAAKKTGKARGKPSGPRTPPDVAPARNGKTAADSATSLAATTDSAAATVSEKPETSPGTETDSAANKLASPGKLAELAAKFARK